MTIPPRARIVRTCPTAVRNASARETASGRLGRPGRGAQRSSVPHPGVHRGGGCARRRAFDAKAAEVTRPAFGPREVADGAGARSVAAPDNWVQEDRGRTPATRRSDGEAAGPGAGPSRNRSASGGWNERMTRILREAAEVRDQLERARSTENDRLAKDESEACLALIGTLATSASQSEASRGGPRRERPIGVGAR
jgi:hypothetical protein